MRFVEAKMQLQIGRMEMRQIHISIVIPKPSASCFYPTAANVGGDPVGEFVKKKYYLYC